MLRHNWKVIAQTPLLLMQKALHYGSLTEQHDGLQGVHTWNTCKEQAVQLATAIKGWRFHFVPDQHEIRLDCDATTFL